MFTCCSITTEALPGEGRSLRIKGAATFEHEQELYRTILNALKSSRYLELSCGSILQADYSFVMLICAAHRTAEVLGRRLAIRERLPGGRLQYFEQARQSRGQGCIYTPGEQCLFWQSLSGVDGDEDPADAAPEQPAPVTPGGREQGCRGHRATTPRPTPGGRMKNKGSADPHNASMRKEIGR